MRMDKLKGTKAVKILIIVILLAGMIGIAAYPFPNRNLALHFTINASEFVINLNNEKIKDAAFGDIIIETNSDEILIEKLDIYTLHDFIILKEVGYEELARYIAGTEQGELQWTNEGLELADTNIIHLSMNEEYITMIQELSQSFLQERIILAGVYFCLIMFLFFMYLVFTERKTEENWDNHGPIFEIRKFLEDIVKYRQYMIYAARTDLKAEVANSYLNRLWWLLEPFFNMIVYVIVFGNIMGRSVENYSTFIFSALLMWNFFSKTINFSVKLVRNSKDIITKVYIPKFILLLSNMILNFFKLIFSAIVLVVMMIIFQIHIGWNLFWVFPAYAVIFMLAFGVGMIFLHFGVYVDDLSYAVSILLNMLMFLSGIFYSVLTTLPEPLNLIMMCLNPIAMIIDTMREALLYNKAANIPILGMWFLISLITCYIGVHIVYKNENSYVKIV